MNTASKTFLLVSAAYLLSGGSLTLAETQGGETAGQTATRVVMENPSTGGGSEGQVQANAQSGSVKVTRDDEPTLAAAAKVNSAQAATIAQQAHPGTVVETKLDKENGYLVWKVDLVDAKGAETQLRIDAGNGQVLAMRAGHEGEGRKNGQDESDEGAKHSGWKFWESWDKRRGQRRTGLNRPRAGPKSADLVRPPTLRELPC